MKLDILGVYTGFSIKPALRIEETLDEDSGYAYDGHYALRYSIDKRKALMLLPRGEGKYAVAHTQIGGMQLPFTNEYIREAIQNCDGVVAILDGKKKRTLSVVTYRGTFDHERVALLVRKVALRGRKRDSQRKKVYMMDHLLEPKLGYITQKEARNLFNQVIADYKYERNRCEYAITQRFKTKLGSALSLPVDALYNATLFCSVHIEPSKVPGKANVSVETLLHELAHLLQVQEWGRVNEAHGPEFVTLMGELMIRYAKHYGNKCNVTPEHYVALCKKMKVEVFEDEIVLEDGKRYKPKKAA